MADTPAPTPTDNEPTKGDELLLALYFPNADRATIDPDSLADQVASAVTDDLGVEVEVGGLPVPQWLNPAALAAVRNHLSAPFEFDVEAIANGIDLTELRDELSRRAGVSPQPEISAERLFEVISDALTQSGQSHVIGSDVARARNAVLPFIASARPQPEITRQQIAEHRDEQIATVEAWGWSRDVSHTAWIPPWKPTYSVHVTTSPLCVCVHEQRYHTRSTPEVIAGCSWIACDCRGFDPAPTVGATPAEDDDRG